MAEGNARSGKSLHDAPLSSAFDEAWQQWSQAWNQLPKDGEDKTLVDTVVELSGRISQRLWRTAFAKVGDAAPEQVKALVYAFAALVDETLLFTPWPGQAAWQEKPLESRMYASRQAGERIPLAIHKLLSEKVPGTRDLANVYLLCLVLGFQGRLRGEAGQVQHEKLRLGLFQFAWQHEAGFADVSALLEQPTRVKPVQLAWRQSLPDGLRLGIAIGAVMLLLTGLGQLFWRDIRQDLEPVLQLTDSAQAQEQEL